MFVQLSTGRKFFPIDSRDLHDIIFSVSRISSLIQTSMISIYRLFVLSALVVAFVTVASAQSKGQPNPAYDAELAKKLGGNDGGMRQYIFVLLKTGPTPVPAGKERDAMFAGHMANINRLADEGKLVMAGPLDRVEGWRGLFIFAVTDIEEAKKLVATDPVITKGEMIAEYHKWFGSAGVMMLNDIHKKISKTIE